MDQGEVWNEIAVIDGQSGAPLARLRVHADTEGLRAALRLIRRHAGRSRPLLVTEGSSGLFMTALRQHGVDVRTIHVITSAQWRHQQHVAGSKSDRTDALMLAEFGRVQPGKTRPLRLSTAAAQRLKVLGRACDELSRERQRVEMQFRAMLLDYYPGALRAFRVVHRTSALVTLLAAPTPAAARSLHSATLLRELRGARVNASQGQVRRRLEVLRAPNLRRPATVEEAEGEAAVALLHIVASLTGQLARLESLVLTEFQAHPQWPVYASFPALGKALGARVLGEIGDDMSRFRTARDLCAYAGTAPVTRASGTRSVTHRRLVCNRRLANALTLWSLPLIRTSPAARAHYDARRARGDHHSAAARNVAGRYLRMLHHCLTSGEPYKEEVALRNIDRRGTALEPLPS